MKRRVLPALQGSGAAKTRKEIRVSDVGIFKAIKGVANRKIFVHGEPVIDGGRDVVADGGGRAGIKQKAASVIHVRSVR